MGAAPDPQQRDRHANRSANMITKRRAFGALGTALVTVLWACGGGLSDPGSDDRTDATLDGVGAVGDPVTADTILVVSRSGIMTARREMIRSEEEWQAAWAEVMQNVASMPQLPRIDFAARSVVLVAMGERPSGGYGLELTAAEAIERGLRLRIDEVSPGPKCITTQALTQPVLVLSVPARGDVLEVESDSVVRDCS
jgi:hypothetical protein